MSEGRRPSSRGLQSKPAFSHEWEKGSEELHPMVLRLLP
jgi:hypothetical protein